MATTYLIIGESCQDIFEYGRCERLSPEAPVPIFIPENKVQTGGMAKNVYNNLIAIIRAEKNNDSVYHLFSRNEAIKRRYVDSRTNHYFLRVDEHDNLYEQIDFEAEHEYLIKMADCIIISDYAKGFLKEEDIEWIYQIKKSSTVVFLDSKKKISETMIKSCDFLKINEKEYKNNFSHFQLGDYTDKLIVTLGENGAMHSGKLYASKNPQNTIDVSGAGDTFLAALAFKFMEKKNISDAIDHANLLSSKVVSKKGVSTI